jgi:multiple sugar transport system permease protein
VRATLATCSRQTFLVVLSVVTLIPLGFTFLTSLKFLRDIVSGELSFTPTLINYHELFVGSRGIFGRLLWNSLVTGVGSTLLVLFVGTLAAYSLSRFPWGRLVTGLVMGWLLFVNMLPPIVFVGPFYLLSRSLSLYDTPPAVILAHMVINMPLAIWMLQDFFREIPRELEEAALVDGCDQIQSFWRIILPIARPGLAATAILVFIFSWNEFLLALSLTSTPNANTLPVGIASFVQEHNIRYGEMAAASFLATLPALVMVFFAQRQIVRGLTLGALKG